jgi:hypothetical protein
MKIVFAHVGENGASVSIGKHQIEQDAIRISTEQADAFRNSAGGQCIEPRQAQKRHQRSTA